MTLIWAITSRTDRFPHRVTWHLRYHQNNLLKLLRRRSWWLHSNGRRGSSKIYWIVSRFLPKSVERVLQSTIKCSKAAQKLEKFVSSRTGSTAWFILFCCFLFFCGRSTKCCSLPFTMEVFAVSVNSTAGCKQVSLFLTF